MAKEDSRVALDNRETREGDSWRLRGTHMEETATHTLEGLVSVARWIYTMSISGSAVCTYRRNEA
jgi:hypothetical protein